MSDGGTAFPCEWSKTHNTPGMSLRDYFAAKAMQSLATVAPQEWHEAYEDDPQYLPMIKGVSLIAYQFADEMIKARKTGEKQ